MNEELQQALADIILKATDTAGAAKDFVLAEMPDVIHQLLMWKMVESLAGCLLAFGLVAAIVVYWRWIKRNWDKEWLQDENVAAPLVLVGGTASIALFLSACVKLNLAWLQILIAPKIYLIEYAARLVK